MKIHNRSKIDWEFRPWITTVFLASCVGAVAALQPVSVVNVPVNSPAGGSSDSVSPIVSANGRYVLFASLANNLTLVNVPHPVQGMAPPVLNVYLRDRLNQSTKLISIGLDGAGGGNGDSMPRGISTNGQYVLFESAASNLVPGDTNGVGDLFIRDLVNNATSLVGLSTNGAVANGISRSGVMTPDGRYVAFVSAAKNLVADDTNGIPDVFVRDMQAATTTLVSVGAQSLSSFSASELPVITPQGRYVAFYSVATNLVPGLTNNTGDIYVRDLVAGTTIWVSTNAGAIMNSLQGNSNVFSSNFEISDDGQFVAYEASPVFAGTQATFLLATNGILLRHNLGSGLTDIVNTNIPSIVPGSELNDHNVSLTPDGRFVAFTANCFGYPRTQKPRQTAVEVWDALSNTTVVVSTDLNQVVPTNSLCDWPSITPDGRYVVFSSNATNLTANPMVSGFHLYVRDLQAGTTVLVDADTNGAASTLNVLAVPQLSEDGTAVVFEAPDGNLVANDNNRATDIFVRNVGGGSTELISVGLPGLPSRVANGSCVISSSCPSTNGRYVAFSSEADNLVAGDTNGYRDIYIRDLAAGINVLASVNTNGSAANSLSSDPALSGNGRFVAFTSSANNLVTDDTNNVTDVFWRDLQSGTTLAVSTNISGTGTANKASYSPSISDDGRYVLFFSLANDLVLGGVSHTSGDLFWYDVQAGTNKWLTRIISSLSVSSLNAAMTPDGKRVVFSCVNGSTTRAYVWDAQMDQFVYTNTSLSGLVDMASKSAISPDGKRIAFNGNTQMGIVNLTNKALFSVSRTTGSHLGYQFSADGQFLTYVAGSNVVYLYNFANSNNVVVSADTNGISESPTISADGRFVAYRSSAANLVTGDSNGVPDIFLYDQLFGTTTLVTASPYGDRLANGRSSSPLFSADGQTLIWQSWASDLAGQVFNQSANLFAMQAFATNSSDPQAAIMVTDFGFSSLSGFGSSATGVAMTWTTRPGSNYMVQFKNTVDETDWQAVTGAVRVIGSQGFFVDVSPNATQRFYRVLAF